MICDTTTRDDVINNSKNKELYFLTYSFTSEEVCLLAKFLRDKQKDLPAGLDNFNMSLERAIYNNLTIEEAKRFYS